MPEAAAAAPVPSVTWSQSPPHTPERHSSALQRSWTWTVKLPPVKKHMVQGHLVPTTGRLRIFSKKTRRLALELHGPALHETPVRQGHLQALLEGSATTTDDLTDLKDKQSIVLRVLKKGRDADGDDDDDASDHQTTSVVTDATPDAWVESRTYRLDELKLTKVHGRTVEVHLGAGREVQVRDVKFESEADATAFATTIQKLVQLEHHRAQRQAQSYLQSRSLETTTRIRILLEIVSATNLPIADLSSSDPYVLVRLGSREIHRTSVVSKNLNPIWTLETQSLCLLDATPEEFFGSAGGVKMVLKDYDSLGANEVLGSVTVPLEDLLEGTGEREVYEIVPDPKGPKIKPGAKQPKLYLRFKPASPEDVEVSWSGVDE